MVPVWVSTGPSVLLFIIHWIFAGALVLIVHHKVTWEPDNTSLVAGAMTLGGSITQKQVD